ncbi:hypothetical protein Barb4_00177 [Bacteroidales bacterium Barb4]|nr:hypothetical protein Barb4_00177 [Bacteroidales bacterium Barb4]
MKSITECPALMKHLFFLSVFLALVFPLTAQTKKDAPWSINEATMFGMGGYNLEDTYLSPGKGVNYTGTGFRILNERMKMTHLADYTVSRQQLLHLDLASTYNPAMTATDVVGFIDYSLGWHYRFRPADNLKVLAGASARGLLGFIYNTRNGNNPASVKADADLNLSVAAIYGWRIKNYLLTFRYQAEMPFAGVFFSPHYSQSYYEIFDLGNDDGVVQFNTFHNKFAMKNYLTVDFPAGVFTVRAGYLHSYYYTDVNNIRSHIISHTFLLGLVKEFVSFGGRRLKDNRKYRSAYY